MIAPRYCDETDGGAVCRMCFRGCTLRPGGLGACGVRGLDWSGSFVSPQLGRFSSIALDPIEKKPLRRWKPGTTVLSIGSVGCMMFCPFCQNHEIAHPSGEVSTVAISPEELAQRAGDVGVPSVAYTYNEPTLQAEHIIASASLLHERSIDVVMVTNGMFSQVLCDDLASCVDAMNIDLKAFDSNTYASLGGDLDTLMRNVETLASRGVHIELTCLIVPGISDRLDDLIGMTERIAEISREMPLHLSRYFPRYRYDAPPTDVELLKGFEREVSARLKYVYLGNV